MSKGKKASKEKDKGTFVHEFPLKVTRRQEKEMLVRLDCGRQLYNACLGECLRRFDLMRESKAWRAACALPKPSKNPDLKGKLKKENDARRTARNQAFKAVNQKYGFTEYSLHEWAGNARKSCHIGEHIHSQIAQTIATRAFNAVQQYAFHKRGRPRFKGKNQMDSLEGKSNVTGIRWKDGKVLWGVSEKADILELAPIPDKKDKKGVEAHALVCHVKYVRIVRRKIKEKNRFYAQLVLEGHPLSDATDDETALDLGPSSIAAVSRKDAFLEPFCMELQDVSDEIRKLQRKMSRQLLLNNQDALDEKGKYRKGVKLKRSNRYRKNKLKLGELFRLEAATRKKLHGELSNRVLAMGKFINIEKISYRGWQKLFGKSVGFRAPGMFVEMLRRKAESAGGRVNEFPTALRCSQTCHHCGAVKKKPLSQRWHKCECGVHAQRDLYSAFLALCVTGNHLDMEKAERLFAGVEPLLWRAISSINQAAKGKTRLACLGLGQGQSRLRANVSGREVRRVLIEASDDVAGRAGACADLSRAHGKLPRSVKSANSRTGRERLIRSSETDMETGGILVGGGSQSRRKIMRDPCLKKGFRSRTPCL